MTVGEADEILNVGQDGVHAALHGGDGIALALQANTLSHDGTELLHSRPCRAAGVCASQVATENENLIILEISDVIGCEAMAVLAQIVVVAVRFVGTGTMGFSDRTSVV